VGPRKVPGAHQELPGDLPPGEPEGLLEQANPVLEASRVMMVQPCREGPVGLLDLQDAGGVGDGGLHLQAVPHDARIRQEALPVLLPEAGHLVHPEAGVGLSERVPFLQDGEPGQARLVDLQDQPLEEKVVVPEGEAVLTVVVGPVPGVARGRSAVAGEGFGFVHRKKIGRGAGVRRRCGGPPSQCGAARAPGLPPMTRSSPL
jgi:hypothetical protein